MPYGDEIVNIATVFVLFVLLAVAVATDLKSRRIPNLLLLPALSLALMLHAINSGMAGLVTASGGLLLGLAILMPLYAVGVKLVASSAAVRWGGRLSSGRRHRPGFRDYLTPLSILVSAPTANTTFMPNEYSR